jgi:hypothetical protein
MGQSCVHGIAFGSPAQEANNKAQNHIKSSEQEKWGNQR